MQGLCARIRVFFPRNTARFPRLSPLQDRCPAVLFIRKSCRESRDRDVLAPIYVEVRASGDKDKRWKRPSSSLTIPVCKQSGESRGLDLHDDPLPEGF